MFPARSATFAAILLAGAAGSAAAQDEAVDVFIDCMAAGYLDSFLDAPSASDLACVELFRLEVSTPNGSRFIRGIADAASDWAAPPDMIAEVERGARLAGAAFADLGRFSVDNITLLILDDVYATSEVTGDGSGGEVLGITFSDREAVPDQKPECLITIYALTATAVDGSMPVTIAHEIFHCIQGATYAGAKYQSYGEGGAWWMEGTAEAFAAAAIPESLAYTDRSDDFDTSVERRYALNRMLHQAVHFFYWLMQTQGGLKALMPFQDLMAESGDPAAQHAAMRRALEPEGWQAFAEAYADSTITHPQGGTLASSPPEGTVMTFDATGRQTLPLEPFAISLGRATFGCGVWGNTAAPDHPQMTWKAGDAAPGDAWRALPEELDTREGADTDWRLVTLPVDDSLAEGEVEAERRQGCSPCLGTSAVDACLIGTWAMTGGGPAEWMEAQGFPATVDTSGSEQMTLRADGGFVTGAFEVSLDLERNGLTVEGDGSVPVSMGNWSAEGGTVNFCNEAGGGMSGRMTVTTEDGSSSATGGSGGGGSMSMGYACTSTGLTTTLPMRGLPDMLTTYRRVTE
jgi:hypothetical protein